MIFNFVLYVSQALIIVVATILLTRRYRQRQTVARRFLMLGFWCLFLGLVFPWVGVGLTALWSNAVLASSAKSVYSQSRADAVIAVVGSLGEASNLCNVLGILALAYGAIRIRGASR